MKKIILSSFAFLLLSIFSAKAQNTILYDSFDPGYRGTVEAGYSYGLGRDRSNMVSILTTHGFAFSPIVFVGIGGGVDMLMYNEFNGSKYNENLYFIPLYADLKLNLFRRGIAPYIDFRIGSTFLCNKEDNYNRYSDRYDDYFFTESLYFSPSFGVHIPLGEKTAFNIGVTYTLICNGLGRDYYYDDYDYNYNSGYRKSNLTINSIGGRIAFEF